MPTVHYLPKMAINQPDIGVHLEIAGPFPTYVQQELERGIYFSSYQILIQWFGIHWPEWRTHLTYSEGLTG